MTTLLDIAKMGGSKQSGSYGEATQQAAVRYGTVTEGGSSSVSVLLDGATDSTDSYILADDELVPVDTQQGDGTVEAEVETSIDTGTRVAVVQQGNVYKVISIGTLPDIVEDVEEMQLLVRYVENVDDYTGVGTWTGTLVGKIPASGSGTYSGMGALANANASFDIVYFDYSYSTGEVTEMGYRNSSFGPHRARLGLDMTSYGMVELFGNTFQLAGGSLDGSGISWWNQLASSHGPIYLFPPDNSSVIIGTDDPDMGRMADGDESMANWDSVGHDVSLTVHGPIYADSGIYLNAASSTQVDVGTALTAAATAAAAAQSTADAIGEVSADSSWSVAQIGDVKMCWRDYTVSGSVAITSAWGNVYSSGSLTTPNFPTGLFTAAPWTDIQLVSASGNAWVMRNPSGGVAPSTTNPGSFQLERGNSTTLTRVTVRIIAIGV